MAYSVTWIPAVKTGTRRGIVFLECQGDRTVNALKDFEKMKENRRRDLLRRFDHWIDGLHHPKYHHGWDEPDRRDCYVFKVRISGSHHRFYGFLIHPTPASDPRFELCVLVSHVVKNTDRTDPSELKRVLDLKANQEVAEAIRRMFADRGSHGN